MTSLDADRLILRRMLESEVKPNSGNRQEWAKARGVVRRFLTVHRALASDECERLAREWVFGRAA